MGHRIGMIGLGNMGSRIATHLAGLDNIVYGCDVAVKSLAGVEVVDLPVLVKRSEVILLSLPNSVIIESVLIDKEGVINHCAPGQAIIDMSSAAPASTKRLYDAFKAKGVEYLDAAVSGGTGKAADGTLTIMAGGDQDAFDKHLPLLKQMGSGIHFMGKSGSGDAMKAINNFLTAVTLAATGEAMVVAKAFGLELAQVLDVLNSSSGESYATQYRFPKIIKGDYIEGGLSSNLMIKDVEVYRGCAQELNVPVIMGDFVASVFRLAVGAGKGGLVSNRIVDVIGDLAGGIRLKNE